MMSYKNEGDEATKGFLRHHFRNHGLTALRYFPKRGFMETLVKAYNICVTMVAAKGHRHQLSIPPMKSNSEGVPNRFEKKKMIRKKRIIGEEGTHNCKNHISHYLPKIEASNNRIGKRMLQSPNSVSSKKMRVGESN